MPTWPNTGEVFGHVGFLLARAPICREVSHLEKLLLKNLMFLLLLLVAVMLDFGPYRGWFTMNQQRIEQDKASGKSEMYDLGRKAKDKTLQTNCGKRRKMKLRGFAQPEVFQPEEMNDVDANTE